MFFLQLKFYNIIINSVRPLVIVPLEKDGRPLQDLYCKRLRRKNQRSVQKMLEVDSRLSSNIIFHETTRERHSVWSTWAELYINKQKITTCLTITRIMSTKHIFKTSCFKLSHMVPQISQDVAPLTAASLSSMRVWPPYRAGQHPIVELENLERLCSSLSFWVMMPTSMPIANHLSSNCFYLLLKNRNYVKLTLPPPKKKHLPKCSPFLDVHKLH